MATYSSAIVGTGFIGPVHIEALRRLGRPIAGVLGSSPDKGQQLAEKLRLPKAYSTLEELLQDKTVRVVHLTSPNRFHYEQCIKVLNAGKHVICEKPLAMTSEESADLVRRAALSSLVAAVNYNVRFYPLCLETRRLCQQQQFGTIYHITGCYLQDWLLYDTDFNWRVLASEGGALRAVADIGTHWMDLMSFITGLKVEAVFADLHTVHPVRKSFTGSNETFSNVQTNRPFQLIPIDTEDFGNILVRFHGGAKACFTVSQVNAGRKNQIRFEIAGSQGSVAWDSEEPNLLRIGYRDRPNQLLMRDPSLLPPEIRGFTDYPGGHNEGFPDTFKQLFKAIYSEIDSYEAGDSTRQEASFPFPTFEEGHREILFCEAVLKSHREQRWVSIEAH